MKTISALILAASVLGAHAQTSTPYSELKDGDLIEAQSIAFDFGAPIPMPPGKWRLLKRYDYSEQDSRSWSGNKTRTRLTFSSEDKNSPFPFFSLSTNLTKANGGAYQTFKCEVMKVLEPRMVVVSDFHLSSSGFEFGCAIGRTFDPHTQFSQIAESQRLESTSGPMDFGFKEGVVKPILEQDPKLKSLGNSALLVDYEIEESFARISRYTYILALSKPMIAPSRSPALVNWMQATGMALLQVNQGKTVQPPLPPDGIRNLQPLERKYELVADVLRDKPIELTRMFTEEKFATAYLRFLKERPELNRAFCTNKKGNMWGFMSNAWPYNERRAYDTCYIYGRGKESPIVFHTTDRVFHGATQD